MAKKKPLNRAVPIQMINPAGNYAQILIDLYDTVYKEILVEINSFKKMGYSIPKDLAARRQRIEAMLLSAQAQTEVVAPALAYDAYKTGSNYAIKKIKELGMEDLAVNFGPRDIDAVRVISINMVDNYNDAIVKVGRRVDDVFREVSLQAQAESLIAGEDLRSMEQRLETGLRRANLVNTEDVVRVSNRNLKLNYYSEMVSRTTAREAASQGLVNRLIQNNLDLVTVDDHPNSCDKCASYQGKTFSLTGSTPNYPILDIYPPFHPNCRHVLTPASIIPMPQQNGQESN